MKRRCLPALAAAFAAALPAVAGCTGGGTQSGAIQVSGTAAYRGGNASVTSVSCASPGNCSAGGTDGFAFVVSEVNGNWGAASRVRFAAAVNNRVFGEITSVSCASPGNCSAGGSYQGRSSRSAFVVSEVNGTWGTAIEVPGAAVPSLLGSAGITSVSCASPGNCSAGGSYTPDEPTKTQAFVVSEVRGTWGAAMEVPGTAAMNQGGNAGVTSVSCGSPGNCAAAGTYWRRGSNTRAFVADEANGIWEPARQVRSPAALRKVMNGVEISSVSCASAGNCGAVGTYTGAGSGAFVVSEVNGTWGPSRQVTGAAALKDAHFNASSVSCGSPGSCTAAGSASPGGVFVISEVNGTWGKAREVPGPGALHKSSVAQITSVWCASADYCGAGGYYANGRSNRLHGRDSGSQTVAFVFSDTGG